MVKISMGLPLAVMMVLVSCGETPSTGGGSSEAPVSVELGGATYQVALGQVRSSCSDPSLAELDCAEVMTRAKVTRPATPMIGSEDERAAVRQVIGTACEARGMSAGRFSPTAGVYQSGVWVFDDACGV